MTVAEIQAIYDQTLAAYQSALSGKSYSISSGGTSRSFARNDIDKLREELRYWERKLQQAQNGQSGIQVKFGTPLN